MRYRLRTLLIVMALLPVWLAAQWFLLVDVFRPVPTFAMGVYLTVTITAMFVVALASLSAVARLATRLLRRR